MLDLSGVTFLDSTALGAILIAARRLREEQGGLAIVTAEASTKKLLSLVGVDRVVPVSTRRAGARAPRRQRRAAQARAGPIGDESFAIAKQPTQTITRAERRRRQPPPDRAPTKPPIVAPAAISSATPQSTSATKTKMTRGDDVRQAGEDVLDRVDPLQVVVQGEPEDREQHDPLRGAEVAAVDAGSVDAASAAGPACSAPCSRARAIQRGQPRLHDHEHERDRDEDRDDRLERGRRQHEQQDRAGEAAEPDANASRIVRARWPPSSLR